VHGLTCMACPPGFYNSLPGQMQCLFCPSNDTETFTQGRTMCSTGHVGTAMVAARTGGPQETHGARVSGEKWETFSLWWAAWGP
jgi:hypothetical protein